MSRLIDLALRTWPPACRDTRGEELADTAAALAADRSMIREASSLAMAGLGARYRAATRAEPRRTWAAAARIALLTTMVVIASMFATHHVGISYGSFTVPNRNDVAAQLGFLVAHGALFVFALVAAQPRVNPDGSGRAPLVLSAALFTWLVVGQIWYLGDSLLIWVTLGAAVVARHDPRLLAGLCLHWATRFAMWIPGLATGELIRTNVSKFYMLVATVLLLSTIRVHRSIRRAGRI